MFLGHFKRKLFTVNSIHWQTMIKPFFPPTSTSCLYFPLSWHTHISQGEVWSQFLFQSTTWYTPKVPILKECHFGKMKLWRVEHFWTLFVFTFGRDCYCIQQSRPKMKTKSVQKCSTRQSFTFPKWHSFKIGTLAKKQTCLSK